MAVVIGFFQNTDTPKAAAEAFKEGPFVICNPLGNGWRIEVELKGAKSPVLPDLSVSRLWKRAGFGEPKFHSQATAAQLCDWLNQQVKIGSIVCNDGNWEAA